jgi:hypothetical protein
LNTNAREKFVAHGQPEPIGRRPASGRKGGVKLSECARKHKINRVAGQPVAGTRVARHALALKDFEAHANATRKDDIRRHSIT